CNLAGCAFSPYPLVPPEDKSEGVNLIQDETTPIKKPRLRRAGGAFYCLHFGRSADRVAAIHRGQATIPQWIA
ncbi:hypothetical protein QF020_005094, partial [Pseudomonas frederiksbergensis]|uniref:hypothetical protein n=1 Tax=Pseudomonas frederiksbergensis TaxID=104087 RepID=UPI003D231BD1